LPSTSTDLDDTDDLTPDHPAFEDMTFRGQLANATLIFLPLLGAVAAMAFLWGRGFGWPELALVVGSYIFTAGSVTIGYHRYFTHKAFSCPRWVQAVLGVGGSMSMQGALLEWVAVHRCHHQHADRPGDPHSPHVDHDHHNVGESFGGLVRGYWHAHTGWLFGKFPADVYRYVPDLASDPMLRTISRLFPLWTALGLLLPAAIGGLITRTWLGAAQGLIWGGLVRVFLVHHVTWSINSACHIWGQRTYKSHDHSRNNVLFGLLALGEGWHNNHHAFPASARHGLAWWQFDASYLFIRLMESVGLAWDLNLPSSARLAAKRIGTAKPSGRGSPISYQPMP
jgi:stearoyl-CoA desaturase (Delta-9 desaturase)